MGRLAYFVSPHGLGHAARSAAVLSSLSGLRPDLRPHIFTTVRKSFWHDSLQGSFDLLDAVTDVGMVQLSPLEEDPLATRVALDRLRPFSETARPLVEVLERLECRCVVSDISPIGLAAARCAGLPSVLVENFTWDWIYQAYFDAQPKLSEIALEMAGLFESADLRIQTRPVCQPVPGAMTVAPVSRRARTKPAAVRSALELDERPIVVITMGGHGWDLGFVEHLARAPEFNFVAFSGTPRIERIGNTLLLPERSPVFLPDLVATAEVVVGKLGYSTVAEAWAAGTRYAYIPRTRFPEGPILAEFVRSELPAAEIEPSRFTNGEWIRDLPALLDQERPPRQAKNGADEIARELASMLP